MKKSIFKSICLVAIGVFAAAVILIMGLLYSYFSSVQTESLKKQTELAAIAVENQGLDYFNNIETKDFRITLIDSDGNVLYDTQSPAGTMENHLGREEIREALARGYGESSRYSSTILERQIYTARKLPNGSVIRLSESYYSVFSLIIIMTQPILIIAVIAVILSMLLASRLSEKIVKPLNELNLDNPEIKDGYEEIRPLIDRIKSQQKQLRAEKEKSEQMRCEFSANVSHELKTPLHSISGYAELIKNGIVKENDIPEFSSRIYSEAQRMISLVEDIIRLSRLDEGGSSDMKKEETDLYALAEENIQILQSAADRKNINISLNGEKSVITGYPQLLSGIIHNLCDNAIKYNHENGSVDVVIRKTDKGTLLSVSDTGIGIPAEHKERVFERFYRVDKSHSKEVGGTGLGLSIVKHAAKIHKADITIDSIPDGGTTITVFFPENAI